MLDAILTEAQEWALPSAEMLRDWLNQTETYMVPKSGHWYSGQNDRGITEELANFFSRHTFS